VGAGRHTCLSATSATTNPKWSVPSSDLNHRNEKATNDWLCCSCCYHNCCCSWLLRIIIIIIIIRWNLCTNLWTRSQNFENGLLPSSCLSVRMEQLGSHWTDFHEISYVIIFRKCLKTFRVSLKSDKNNGYFTWRPMYIDDSISLYSSKNEKCFRQK
jgi:hypothetical protein